VTSVLIFLLLGAGLGFWLMVLYNQLVELRGRVRSSFALFDAQLTRRHDLIENLVDTAQGLLARERAACEAVRAARGVAHTDLRRAVQDPTNAVAMQKLGVAEQLLGEALERLLAVLESAPDLRAGPNLPKLADELGSADNRVAFARQTYNEAVTAYNQSVEHLPGALIAQQLAFRPAVRLELDPTAKRETPRVAH
jgi:LemA protein